MNHLLDNNFEIGKNFNRKYSGWKVLKLKGRRSGDKTAASTLKGTATGAKTALLNQIELIFPHLASNSSLTARL